MTSGISKDPRRKGPVLVDYSASIDGAHEEYAQPKDRRAPRQAAPTGPAPSPAEAPPIDEGQLDSGLADGRAMRVATALLRRPPSVLTRWFLSVSIALVGFLLAVAAWRYVTGLIAIYPVTGWIATGLLATFLTLALAMAFREWLAFARLRSIGAIRRSAVEALNSGKRAEASAVTSQLDAFYMGRPEMELPRVKLAERLVEDADAAGLIHLAESELMAPLDAAARAEIEVAARTVATVTALVPIALADVLAALSANLRMIRRIAEIYGGRASSLGTVRLARTVVTHLVATGALAAGDDLIEAVAGGGILSKVSRRFGEGVVNGALTARVGVAAIEVCRPLPFVSLDRPRVGALVKDALVGLFDYQR